MGSDHSRSALHVQTPAAQPTPCRLAGIAALWLLPTLYACWIVTLGSFDVLRPAPPHGLVFNSMLSHLLAGRFDVDPAAIGEEAFVHDGRFYAYFGIFGALLRLPLLLSGGLDRADITTLSMLTAASLGWISRLGALLTVCAQAPRTAASRSLCAIVILSAALGGESIQFLRPSIYQEVITWASALASGFVFLLVRLLLVPCPRRTWLLCGMAGLAGLTLLTRPTTALGLYAALGLLLCVDLLRAARAGWRTALRVLLSPSLLAPSAILLFFAVAAGAVNMGRWGNPFVFMDMHLYAKSHTVYLDRIPRLERYGEFNVSRIPFGIQYYFFPVWMWQSGDGRLLWQDHMLRLTEDVELPPGSLILSDPVTCLLAAVFAWRFIRNLAGTVPNLWLAAASLLGLAVPGLLILMFVAYTHRYRMEFYPLLDSAACFGLAVLLREPLRRLRLWGAVLGAAGVIGIIVAHAALFAYLLTPLGPVTDLDMSRGWIGLYRSVLDGRQVRLDHHVMP
jgi:hypothetical protein